jgi:sugar lactone lactonase YvrE
VLQIDPETSKLLQSVQLPVTLVTSAVWGGENLETLYVTTSRHGLSDEDLALQPLAGSTFKITGLGVVGTLANNVRLPPI